MFRRRKKEAKGDERRGIPGLLRDIAFAALIVGVVFGLIFAYTQVYPPLVVVESESMQHSDDVSYVGVIDTGDLVFVQAARERRDIVTWVEGRVSGHQTYGDYGDVIVFRKPAAIPDPTPVIHRAILYLIPNGSDAYDVPSLDSPFPSSEWYGTNRTGAVVQRPVELQSVTIRGMGWQHNLIITFDLLAFSRSFVNQGAEGYVTMGDHNAYGPCRPNEPCGPPLTPYDALWVVRQGDIVGRARGEIPWFGLLKLLFDPANTGKCCDAWGDARAPRNSWDSLLIALPLVFGSPFIVEGAIGAWRRFVSPHLRGRKEKPEAPSTESRDADPPDPR